MPVFHIRDGKATDADLAKLAGASTVAAQTAALVPIGRYVAVNLPVSPITTASDWFEPQLPALVDGTVRLVRVRAAVRRQQQ